MYISYNKHGIVKAASKDLIRTNGLATIRTDEITEASRIIGKQLILGKRVAPNRLRVAIMCNWGDRCGIATYTERLVRALKPKVGDLKIFAEYIQHPIQDEDWVCRCWKRGESMIAAAQQILDWKPDIVFIQHEFGIFPTATHFLKLLEMLDNTPYVITLHSVYEHLDKTICSAYVKNMIVHSENAKSSLIRLGHLNNIHVIYHGCVEYDDTSELWNIFQNDYAVIQFGFGFNYKGVDLAIDAIGHLKQTHPKFNNIFYCYLCTENPHTRNIQQEYYHRLNNKVIELGLQENVVIMRGFLSEQHVCNFLRTAKLAIFPYKNDEKNVVYGASGAIRNALANGIPVIASDCHHFDEFEGILPRPSNHIELADAIDKVFSNAEYRKNLVNRGMEFVRTHNWDFTADQHIAVFQQVISHFEENVVRVEAYEAV